MNGPEMLEVLQMYLHPGGERRVLNEKRTDGRFTYSVEVLVFHYDEELREQLQDFEKIWMKDWRSTPRAGIFDTRRAAEVEVRAQERWIEEA